MKIAIIDDERPTRSELIFLLSSIWPNAEFLQAGSATEANKLFESTLFNAVFLDINLGDGSGITVASYAKTLQPEAGIVFTTAYEEYAVKAFGLDAVDYILKPFDFKRLQETAARLDARGYTASPVCPINKLAISCCNRVVILDQKDIILIQSDQKNCTIYTSDSSFIANESIGHMLNRLDSSYFYRVQKSYVVNLRYVTEIVPYYNNGYALKVKHYDKMFIPISRHHIHTIRNMFNLL